MQKALVLLVALLGVSVSQHVYSGYCQFDACEATLADSLSCNFESISLGSTFAYSDWTNDGTQWTVTNSNVPVEGVCEEYKEWAVMDKETWFTTGDSGNNLQDRDSAFAEGTCDNVQIADGDNYNCLVTGGEINTQLTSESIDISGATPGSVFLVISESYRDYSNQQKTIYYSLDGGEYQVLTAVVEESTDYTSVTNVVAVPTTADNTSVSFQLEYIDSENGWWWAVGQIGLVSFNCPEGQDLEAKEDGIYCVKTTVETVEIDSECVIVFSDCNFSGDQVEICDEDTDIDISGVKSIYVPENTTFYFYDEVDFEGTEVALTESVECKEETSAFFNLITKHKRFVNKHFAKHHKNAHRRHHQKRQHHQHHEVSGKLSKN